MASSFTTEWSVEARFGWDRMPADVQVGLGRLFKELVVGYRAYCRTIGDETRALNTIPHLCVPDWNMWLRLKTHYQEDEWGAILFIYELEELSKREFDQSLSETRQLPHRLNPAVSTTPAGKFTENG